MVEANGPSAGFTTMIDTTGGGSHRPVEPVETRNLVKKSAMTGRSYQIDSRAPPREKVVLSSATELESQTKAALSPAETVSAPVKKQVEEPVTAAIKWAVQD